MQRLYKAYDCNIHKFMDNPLIAIVGPTAVGKTTFAIDMAQRIGGEIVSADSRQIYHFMHIGTASPTAQERAAVPHHLIDFLYPDEPFSLATYQDLAYTAIADITARGHTPMLVGGTGQYLAAVLQGWNIPSVPPNPALRASLEQHATQHGPQSLHTQLANVDPQAAAAIQPQNVRRVIRALEVYYSSGQPISTQQTHHPPPYAITTYWLKRPTEMLYARIDARIDAMMQAGLLEEVQTLRQRGYDWHLPSMSSLGYIQFRPYLEEQAPPLEDCIQRLKFDTHAFARRQNNWFKRLPNLHLIESGMH